MARRTLLIGALVASLVVLVLVFVAGTGWVHGGVLATLLVLFPAVAVAQVPLVRGTEVPRLEAYGSSAVTLVLLALASAAAAWWPGGSGLALEAPPWGVLGLWTVGLTVAGLGVTLAFKWGSMRLGLREDPILRALLPRSTGEKWAFAGLSVCAGLGEEVAYRGYVLTMLIPQLGLVGAVAVSSSAFGVLHCYQGPQGILRTGIMGAVMAVGLLATGSLWVPILAHTLFDVLAGVFFADWLMVPEEAHGVSEHEGGASGSEPRPSA
jgi:membrane protease YdiL (CAAX protease family)